MESVPNDERRSQHALREVQALISNERFSPGERLPAERELAEMLGVSRPMLREALNILEARGYIDRRSKSGNFVCTATGEARPAVGGAAVTPQNDETPRLDWKVRQAGELEHLSY